MQALIERIGRSVGGVVGTLFQAGRDAVDLCLKNNNSIYGIRYFRHWFNFRNRCR